MVKRLSINQGLLKAKTLEFKLTTNCGITCSSITSCGRVAGGGMWGEVIPSWLGGSKSWTNGVSHPVLAGGPGTSHWGTINDSGTIIMGRRWGTPQKGHGTS